MSKYNVVDLPYGETTVRLKIPETRLRSITTPKTIEGVADPVREIRCALKKPVGSSRISEKVSRGDRVTVLVTDSTRPTPSHLILPPVLEELEQAGVSREDTVIVVANGLHRASTEREIKEMLGEAVLGSYMVVNHDAKNRPNSAKGPSHTYYGDTSKATPIWINSIVAGSDVVIGTGFIESHFFAGYTGGRKLMVPGVAGAETIIHNHSVKMIDDTKARAGVLEGNPIHEDMVEATEIAGLDFIVNVVLDEEKRVAKAVAGDFKEAHLQGVRFLEDYIKLPAPEADIVVTTNGGYPLDRNLYQLVKGISTAEIAVKEGGCIIAVAECRDGVGHKVFYDLVAESESPEDILSKLRQPGFFAEDQWQAQILARAMTKASVIVVTSGIEAEKIEAMHMQHIGSIEKAMEKATRDLGSDTQVAVIPHGTYTILV